MGSNVACTQTLFYFSFRSLREHPQALERSECRERERKMKNYFLFSSSPTTNPLRWRSINPLRFISLPLPTFVQPFAHLGLFHCCLRARPNRYATEKAWKIGGPPRQLSGALGWPTERLRELKRLQKFYTDDVHQSPPSDWLRKLTTSLKHYLQCRSGNRWSREIFPRLRCY